MSKDPRLHRINFIHGSALQAAILRIQRDLQRTVDDEVIKALSNKPDQSGVGEDLDLFMREWTALHGPPPKPNLPRS